MISGRIGFVAGLVGLGLTGHRAQTTHRPLPQGTSVIEEIETTAQAAPHRPARRYRLLALLKGTTF
jgi:hypothetical protein